MNNPFAAKSSIPPSNVGLRGDLEKHAVTDSKSADYHKGSGGVDPSPASDELHGLGMDEVSCRSCRFLAFEGTSRSAATGGECRRHAPAAGAGTLASWPTVSREGWCGEWESGISDEDMVRMARALADSQVDGPTGGFGTKNTDGSI
ncbi:MAG: hypothetical protein P1U68_06180 [Verrucomicrobiales bacterium]|nr:hypothetical protein [Verrucomicrobiales bacterium]